MTIWAKEEPMVRAAQAADWAMSRGIASLTTVELAGLLGVPVSQVPQRMSVPKKRGEWVTPARGLWVPVSPEFRGWGGPPATESIVPLTRHLDVSYYVGWLAAAAVHGAAHHAPQVTHVAVSRLVRDRRVGRADLRFHTREHVDVLPGEERMTRAGPYRISTPEVTALDLASDIALAGGLVNAATVIVDLADEAGLVDATLAGLTCWYPHAAARRVGWIMETFSEYQLDSLADQVAKGPANPARLHPSQPLTGKLDHRWRLRINAEVEVE
ncbi:MAG: type IV toxin-antitoxin system AbiEi family antitoxin [Micrococcales bacterium]|nr:type IV toxin-antitoxin system AbiEi family antitoxin [Micrococcales bacterium]